MYAGPALSTSVRNTGKRGKIISVPTSVKRLVKPRRMTAAGSRGRGLSGGGISLDYTVVLWTGGVSVALFVRHGKASAFSSSADYDQLSPPGVEQSEALGTWLADEAMRFDAVFVGPRKRHEQTYACVTRVLATRGMGIPERVLLPELDEHDGISLVFK